MPLIKAGVVNMQLLRTHYETTAKAIDNYLYNNGGGQLPRHLAIPTITQLTDQAAEAYPNAGDRPARLDWALRKRDSRHKVAGL